MPVEIAVILVVSTRPFSEVINAGSFKDVLQFLQTLSNFVHVPRIVLWHLKNLKYFWEVFLKTAITNMIKNWMTWMKIACRFSTSLFLYFSSASIDDKKLTRVGSFARSSTGNWFAKWEEGSEKGTLPIQACVSRCSKSKRNRGLKKIEKGWKILGIIPDRSVIGFKCTLE